MFQEQLYPKVAKLLQDGQKRKGKKGEGESGMNRPTDTKKYIEYA